MTYQALRKVLNLFLIVVSLFLFTSLFFCLAGFVAQGDYLSMLEEVKKLEQNGPLDLDTLPNTVSSWTKDEIKFLRSIINNADSDSARFEKYIEQGFDLLRSTIWIFCAVFIVFLIILFTRLWCRKNRFKDNASFSWKEFLGKI